MTTAFTHLHVHSAFSFLDSSASVQDLVLRAAQLGQPALALTDLHSITGVPSLVKACGKAGIKPIGGCTVRVDGGELVLLADGPTGWASLCQLLTAAGLRDVKREGLSMTWQDLEAHRAGLVCLSGSFTRGRLAALIRARRYKQASEYARQCQAVFGIGNYYVETTRTLTEGEHEASLRLIQLAAHVGAPVVAANPVHHTVKVGLAAHEALCRVRLGLAPEDEHAELPFNGEGYLKSAEQMARLFTDCPRALPNAWELAERLAPPLDPDVRHYPVYTRLPPGESAFSHLIELTMCGAEKRYPQMSETVKARLIHELETIRDLDFCHYFLVCWDIGREARRRDVRYALRGSGVGSAVAHCLHLSEHDPVARNISFERFLSRGRARPPDLDIDFAHDERDGMMDYLRDAYGHDRVANVSNYVTFRARSLLRDLGKALGFDTGEVDRLRELLGYSRGDDLAATIEATPELRALGIQTEQYADLFALCAQISGLPRHLGTHSSGIVVSDVPLALVAPIAWAAKGVTVAALDKDDVEAAGIGLLKIDELGLRALSAIDIAVKSREQADPNFDYAARDREDPETLAIIRTASTVGCFQLESPAQMALQWKLKVGCFDDLIASVALIRPGPILGGSVDAYIARRHGKTQVTYPLPELEPILAATYGRILFQDQVLDVVRVVGDLSPDEADQYQKAITHARSPEEMVRLGLELYERAKPKGITKKAFGRLWKQIQGFSRYGFAHGHSVAFADHAQGTAWLLHNCPSEFLVGVLSVEPCGFWPVSVVVAEAQRQGVEARGPCVNRSSAQKWMLEDGVPRQAIRCSLAYVKTLAKSASAITLERRARGPFTSLEEFCRRCHFLSREQLEWLALAGALDCVAPNRRQALWSLPVLHQDRAGRKRQMLEDVADGQGALEMPIPALLPSGMPEFEFEDRYWKQWSALGFSPEGHPMMFMREALAAQGVWVCADLQAAKANQRVQIGGLIIRPHRPPTANGVVFFTVEDETGLAHVAVLPDIYQRCGSVIYGGGPVVVTGRAERRGEGVSLLAEGVFSSSDG